MKTRKLRLVSALLALAMMLALLPTAAFAEDGNNKCGENLTWELSEDGTLTISGEGEMENYGYDRKLNTTTTPWELERPLITKVVIKGGVTSIGDNAFSGCANLESVDLSRSIKPDNHRHIVF